ncbi:MAG: triose-phosphate isomerase [Planctomycetota bacterium]
MRTPFIAGNWKMNLDRRQALELAKGLRDALGANPKVDVAVMPPFVYLDEVARALAGSPVRVGAQNMCDEASGAFTGEISAAMLKDVGATMVILGHSERRHLYGETDELIRAKVHAALAAGLDPILCVGETLDEREAGATERVVRTQLTQGLAGVAEADLARITLAYEPVWAIGTGKTATPAMAGEVHRYLRGIVAGLYGEVAANRLRIQYGGSVKPDIVATLMADPDIDGALVGGASLNVADFATIMSLGS